MKGHIMYYIVETRKTVEAAGKDLEEAVKKHNFGVLHVHNLKQALKSKGIEFANECRIFEVCNPKQAVNVLNQDMTLNMALPCRISVYQEGGKTKIGMIRPKALLGMLSSDPKLREVAEEVEKETIKMIDEAK
jgi:uncharacterized protein (DUF302 family)